MVPPSQKKKKTQKNQKPTTTKLKILTTIKICLLLFPLLRMGEQGFLLNCWCADTEYTSNSS